MSSPYQLIEELQHNATASGNKTLERRLADLTLWYFKNREQVGRDNLPRALALLEKAFWINLEVNALLVERIHELENNKPGAHIWTPIGLAVNGDLRKFG